MIFRIFYSVLFLVCVLTGEAQAQLFLENGKVTLAVSGGDHLNGSLIVHNTSSEQVSIKVYWEDFEYKPPYDGTKNFLPAGTAPASASQWVTFSPQTITMPAFGQQQINYTVTVPSQIKEGHYGVLFFEKSSDPLNNGEGVTLVTRVGCLFFIEPKDKNKNAVLENIKLNPDRVTASFVNNGNIVLIPRTTYYIMQEGGLVQLRGEAKNIYVPPGAAASLDIPIKKKLSPGHYTLVVNADLQDGDVVLKEIGLAVDTSGQESITNSQD